MDEIKIWAIDGTEVTEVQRTDQAESERWLEDNLVSKPELLIPGLTLVGRQTQTEGGPLDLLGVDSDGRLVVFELKRGTLNRDAVAQIIDYTSYLDSLSENALFEHIAAQSGAHGIEKIDDFQQWHLEQFDDLSLLKPIRMFLVGLGADDTTARMVSFLADNGVNVTLLTFYGFKQNGRTLLARQVRVEGAKDAASHGAVETLSYAERFENLLNYAGQQGIRSLFKAVDEMFQEHWHGPTRRINAGQLSANLYLPIRDDSGRSRAARCVWIYPGENVVVVNFFERLTQICDGVFESALANIAHEVNQEAGITFHLSPDQWEEHKDIFERLTRETYEEVQRYNRL